MYVIEADRRRVQEQRRIIRERKGSEAAKNRSNNAGSFSDDSPPEGAGASSNATKIPQQLQKERKAGAVARRRGSDELLPQERGMFAPSRDHSDLSAHSSLASGPLHHIVGRAPGTPLYEEDDDEDETTITSDGSRGNTGDSSCTGASADAGLPWHHQQLYRLYGKAAADEFLYPKFEDKKKNVAPKAINPKLRRQGGMHYSSTCIFIIVS